MATISRDARRRRIMERGSDRLALITGRIQTLSSDESTTTQTQRQTHLSSHTASLPASFYQDLDLRSPEVSRKDSDNAPAGELPNKEISKESAWSAGTDSDARPELHKCETSTDAMRTPLDSSTNIQPSQTPADSSTNIQPSQSPSSSTARKPSQLVRSQPHIATEVFTASRISSSISASENTRVLCSVAIALLVVLSYLSIPLLSSIMKAIVASRPLYLLLLTDVTIVLAQLYYEKQNGSKKIVEEAKQAPPTDAAEWGGVSQALENGLLLYKAISAAFLDCSIYAVVVICGLSLL